MAIKKRDKEKMEEKEDMTTENQSQNEVKENNLVQDTTNVEEQIKALEEKINALEKQVEEYKDKFLRKAAEFENFKRRNENDQLNLLKYAAESFILKLLPVIDDFERSLAHIKDANDAESIKNGIALVYDKFMKILAEQGVKPIEALGKPFDVHFHEAIMQKKVDDVEPHTVVEEFEKGYIYKDRVIRHSKVAVSEDNKDSETQSEPNEENQNNIQS